MLSMISKGFQRTNVRRALTCRSIVLMTTTVVLSQIFVFTMLPRKVSAISNSNTPILVSQLSGLTITKIACGGYHSLALASNGLVYAWGRGTNGQLGNGAKYSSSIPVQVSSLENVIAISAGNLHSLAVKSDNTVWAWGYNASGQLGDNGCPFESSTPVQVGTLTNGTAVAGGFRHSLILRSTGAVKAAGLNSDGELGNGSITDSCTLVSVSGSLTHSKVATGAAAIHSLSLVGNNVYSWGDNTYGQLGNGTTSDNSSPVQVSNISTAIAIAGGAEHSLAVLSDNTVRAWGHNNVGQLGSNSTTDSTVPVTVQSSAGGNLGSVTQVAGGGGHSLARKADNTVWAWGQNPNGELGDGTYTQRLKAVQVSGLGSVSVIAVSAGTLHSLALTSTGAVYAWGNNFFSQLGQP